MRFDYLTELKPPIHRKIGDQGTDDFPISVRPAFCFEPCELLPGVRA